jgi:very-short-patch-repair endonuclease
VAALAEQQFGVVTRPQLLGAGLSAGAIGRLLRDRTLIRLHRGVYALGHAVLQVEGHWLAAVLACDPSCSMTHRSAGALWHLGRVPGGVVEVTAPGARRRRPGIVAHQGALDPADVTVHRGIPVTTPSRTLLDLAGVLAPGDLDRTIEQAIRLRLYDRQALDATMRRAHGRRELKPLRAALGRLDPVRARSRFELEARALRAIERAALPMPRVNERIEGHEVDLHWPQQRLVVELDSRAWHTDPGAFERDRQRDGDLLIAGWRVLRVTWRQMDDDPRGVVRRIAQLLA